MKKFILLLVGVVVFYIPISYGDVIDVCTSKNSSTNQQPTYALRINDKAITKLGSYAIPAPGKCDSIQLALSREDLVKKTIHVMFWTTLGVPQDIGTLSFDSVLEFESCEVYIEYISLGLYYKARGDQSCSSSKKVKLQHF